MTPNATLNDRASLEAIYPYSAFEADAGSNSMGNASSRHGVRIETVPDDAGAFRLARAVMALEPAHASAGTAFLCPYMGRAYGFFSLRGGEKGAVEEKRDILQSDADEYAVFIDAIIETARGLHPAAKMDPRRLAGFG